MRIKSYSSFRDTKLFENVDQNKTTESTYVCLGNFRSFPDDQFEQFCQAAFDWSKKNNQPVFWDLYMDPNSPHKEKGKATWDSLMKANKTVSLVYTGDGLVAVLRNGDYIEFAYDNRNVTYDKIYQYHQIHNAIMEFENEL